MSCAACGKSWGLMLKVDAHVRNVCSLPFELLGREIHPSCAGLILCTGCGNHWVKKAPCGCNPLTNAIPVSKGEPCTSDTV
jgi:hypothetical protein